MEFFIKKSIVIKFIRNWLLPPALFFLFEKLILRKKSEFKNLTEYFTESYRLSNLTEQRQIDDWGYDSSEM